MYIPAINNKISPKADVWMFIFLYVYVYFFVDCWKCKYSYKRSSLLQWKSGL